MDVVWGETAGVDGQLWLLCPLLFTLQVTVSPFFLRNQFRIEVMNLCLKHLEASCTIDQACLVARDCIYYSYSFVYMTSIRIYKELKYLFEDIYTK